MAQAHLVAPAGHPPVDDRRAAEAGVHPGDGSVSLSAHRAAVAQALFVTFLWSTSWVLIKIGLAELGPLTFAGARYALAATMLLPLAWVNARSALRDMAPRDWVTLLGLGAVVYGVTQGAQYAALVYLPAVAASLVLSFSPTVVAVLSGWRLGETAGIRQWLGIGAALTGALLYFQVDWDAAHPLGLGIAAVGLLANAWSAIWTRGLMRGPSTRALPLTAVSMAFGSMLLLVVGLALEGPPQLTPTGLGIVVWLAVVNTALAWTLWNRTLRVLPAYESSVINNSMVVQIALLAWLFLGERLGPVQVLGLMLVVGGVLVVQLAGGLHRRS